MAQIKALKVNWLDQAWRISSVISEMPDSPPMSLLEGKGKSKPLSDRQRVLIELLQDTIGLHLQYRSRMVHKITVTLADGDKADIAPQSRNPVATAKTLAFLRKIGVKLKDVDLWAYDAHMKLGRILIDRYVCKEWKRILPLIVASISGETTSETATLKASQPRTRRIELRDKKIEAQRCNPTYSYKQLLTLLEGDGIVTRWDDDIVHWVGEDGTTKATKTGTFKNWKTKK
jgi:hypothetical protein